MGQLDGLEMIIPALTYVLGERCPQEDGQHQRQSQRTRRGYDGRHRWSPCVCVRVGRESGRQVMRIKAGQFLAFAR